MKKKRCRSLWTEEERDKRREEWLRMILENPPLPLKIKLLSEAEEETEEHNDVYIYRTLKYPPGSTPPTAA
jgi:hypothetical protein